MTALQKGKGFLYVVRAKRAHNIQSPFWLFAGHSLIGLDQILNLGQDARPNTGNIHK